MDALTVLVLQFVTGILLALLYVPSAGEAWNSLQILNHQVELGFECLARRQNGPVRTALSTLDKLR